MLFHIRENYALLIAIYCLFKQTVRSVERVLTQLSVAHVETYFVPLVTKLATKEWYTSRASAACLLHLAYPKLSDNRRTTFREMFIKLCADETPLVRKLAAHNLGAFSYEVYKVDQRLPQEFIRTFTVLASDDQVRVFLKI